MSTYKDEKNTNLITKVNEELEFLPDFCSKFIDYRQMRLAASTQKMYLSKFKHFFEYLHSKGPSNFQECPIKDYSLSLMRLVTTDIVLRYVNSDFFRGEIKNATKEHTLACLSSLFTYLCKVEHFDYNPVAAIERPKHVHKEIIALTNDEKLDMLSSIEFGSGLTDKQKQYHEKNKVRDLAICNLLLSSGIRISELVGLNLTDINFEEHYLSVIRKGGDFDMAYFSDSAEESLLEYLEIRTTRYKVPDSEKALFVSENGRIGLRTVQSLVKKYAMAGVQGKGYKISPHKLRSTFATNMLKQTGNVALLKQQLGHKTLEMSQHYARANREEMKNARNLSEI